MRRGRGSWWWAQIERGLVYLTLCIVAVGVGFWMSSRFSPLVGAVILLGTLMLGGFFLDIRIESKLVTEEELKDGAD